ncbi:MAG: hypothetical protein ABSB70_00015 [Candidatus Velthaea sp.]|jgi:hypothetical protein
MFECTWIEGTRIFNILFGVVNAAVCFSVAIPILWWVLPKHRTWFFSPKVDRNQGAQLFCPSMASTDALCRFIPHEPLPWVHPAFFLTTLIIAAALGPRVAYIALRRRRVAARTTFASGGAKRLASP